MPSCRGHSFYPAHQHCISAASSCVTELNHLHSVPCSPPGGQRRDICLLPTLQFGSVLGCSSSRQGATGGYISRVPAGGSETAKRRDHSQQAGRERISSYSSPEINVKAKPSFQGTEVGRGDRCREKQLMGQGEGRAQ